jgi:hypothetical protein
LDLWVSGLCIMESFADIVDWSLDFLSLDNNDSVDGVWRGGNIKE